MCKCGSSGFACQSLKLVQHFSFQNIGIVAFHGPDMADDHQAVLMADVDEPFDLRLEDFTPCGRIEEHAVPVGHVPQI